LYILHTILLFISSLFAYEGTITYEKFYRLNNPLYRSASGDWLGLSFDGTKPAKKLDTYLMGDLRLYIKDNNSLNYSLQEAYVQYIHESYKFYIGRKILDWNQNEKYWGLGYLNANQAFTLLSTEEEGLVGIHVVKEYDPFEFDLLLSYLFVPQLNPGMTIKNGVVESQSEWARLPPRYAVVSGQVEKIYYKLDSVNYKDILLNKSIGGNIKYKWNKSGVSAFAIYKPENTLRSNAVAYYDNAVLKQPVVEAAPTVNHHAYYGLQVFHAFGDVTGRGGISYVDPNATLGKDFPVPITNARKSQTSYKDTGIFINPLYDKEAYAHFSTNLKRKDYELTLNYIHILTKVTRANDDFTSDAVKWKRAIGGSATYFITDNFNIMVDMKYDFARFDNIVNAEVKYNYQRKIYIALGLEMLKAPDDASYWSHYRADDTIYSSMGFYF
jgi:hypothetical protein